MVRPIQAYKQFAVPHCKIKHFRDKTVYEREYRRDQMDKKSETGFKMVGVNDIRDINQTIFLHLIREQQPISRADIAKHTGLRAGTVSAIVNRLIRSGLV